MPISAKGNKTMRSIFGSRVLAHFFLFLGLLVGCSGSAAPIPVEGTIKVAGKPMGDLLIQLIPAKTDGDTKGMNALAVSDSSGNFQMKCDNGLPGAPPGRYVVLVTDNLLNTDEEPGNGPIKIRKSRIPPRFSGATTSQVFLEVTAGKSSGYEINLQ